mgnify:CR=1 FL=1
MTWNPHFGGFYEPEHSGIGAYDTPAEAELEARQWATDEGLEYVQAKEAMN